MKFTLLYIAVLRTALAFGEGTEDYSKAFSDPEGTKVIQFVNDPEASGAAWMLTESLLQFNPQLNAGGQWKIQFDESRFRKVTGFAAGPGYRHKRIQTTKRAGYLYLLLEADSNGRLTSFIFRTSDFGESWQFSRMGKGDPGPPSGAVAHKDPPRKRGREVDLRSMASDSPPQAAAAHSAGTQPLFRVLFDLVLQIRPGANPWTFDNYHTLLLVEMFPKPEIQFSFEVSPAPRYYELKYKLSDRLTVRGGRIWIPFDRMSPHNMFGGFANTSLLRQPGTAAFLPDLWTDLGLGVDWRIVDTSELNLDGQFYVVNGFGDRAADPAGQVGNRYPSFENAPLQDNNGDKAMGLRISGNIKGAVAFGASAYSGRYTRQGDNPRRITLLGVDGQLSPLGGTTLTAGYLYGVVGLPHPATSRSFLRGGFYVELSQRIAERWKLTLRGGASQNDSRVQEPSDQSIFGGVISYDLGMIRLSLQYFRDFLNVPGKVVHEYTALRAVALF